MKISPNPKSFRVSLGDRGEMVAADFLMKQGYELLEKNYRCSLGEIDIVGTKNDRLVFIEVKTRTTHQFGRPEEAVGKQKKKKIIQVANFYLKDKNITNCQLGFAVVAISWHSKSPEVQLIESAFEIGDE